MIPALTMCTVCDRPVATDEDFDRYRGGEGAHLCWRRWDRLQCENRAVDWHARYVGLERRVTALVAALHNAKRCIPEEMDAVRHIIDAALAGDIDDELLRGDY